MARSFIQQIFQAKEVCDASLHIVKMALCATIIDTDRIVVGTDDGLFLLELMKECKIPFHYSLLP